MNSRDPAPSTEAPLTQDVLYALRYYLGGRRAWLGLAILAGLGGLVLNWNWLVAIGLAPVLIALAPCAVMCALGLCMNRMMGGSCSSEQPTKTGTQPETLTGLQRDLAIAPPASVDGPERALAEAEAEASDPPK